ncbi:MAG: hypothetical protein LC753_05625 [Acidobacteria bacterium]|nr:hypothetical protein [Acidobacteriota bacterium]MCA1583579.1 hypothetical protein [Acidobacteriota bacterium]MCA1649770.1 hypothetical protein [Acidobacteriota bacterium]
MILLAVVILFPAVIAVLYWHLRRQPDRRSLWRTTLWIGAVGVTRAVLASLGWYVVEHTGGLLQIPAFAFAMFAWPEAAVFTTRRLTPAPPEFYVWLSFVLVVGTLTLVGLVALVAGRDR